MNLFIETPRQGGSLALGQAGPRVFQDPPIPDRAVPTRADGDALMDGRRASMHGSGKRGRRDRAKRQSGADEPAPAPYSRAQETYAEEIAFAKARDRKKKVAGAMRALAFVLLMPVLLVTVFLASYAVTCILNGASPEQVADLMGAMIARIGGFARDALSTLDGASRQVMP